MKKTGITLLTMGAGNVKVLGETLKSFSSVVDEVIYGDLLLFEQDRKFIEQYKEEFNFKVIKFPFNYIFVNGFSSILNELSFCASNDICIYMNTSEIIDEDYGILEVIKNNPDCNTFYFTHPSESHRWFRCYNKRDLKWSGVLHEQLEGYYKPYHKSIFQMADLEKDMDNSFKAKIFNDVKEIVYFQQYLSIIDKPESLGATDTGWIQFAKDNYDSMKERLFKKGKRYQAFIDWDLEAYMRDAYDNPEFEKERFESSIKIEFQGSPMFLGKK